jgi:hypothetical protein
MIESVYKVVIRLISLSFRLVRPVPTFTGNLSDGFAERFPACLPDRQARFTCGNDSTFSE